MSLKFRRKVSRRDLLRGSLIAGGVLLTGFDEACWPATAKTQEIKSSPAAKMIGVVNFAGEARVPLGEAFGAELDGRLYTDLSNMTAENPVTPTERFFIRTRASQLLDNHKAWTVRVSGHAGKTFDISFDELRRTGRPLGVHLMECAGNVRSIHFGMISVASWAGTPVTEILERVTPKADARRVLISGFDNYMNTSASSVPGASWVFTAEELKKTRAFLATEMNGSLLTRDHGAPVRLVVPGWYGCTCIKWVNEITFAHEAAGATSQMQEYAARTMQSGVPQLAKDYEPAIIEHAAMPIRIEKWMRDEKVEYRVVGILWGGVVPIKRLQIRFNPEEDYVDVQSVHQSGNDSWNLWTHTWQPKQSGSFLIRLRVADHGVITRRLDAGHYMRSVEIAET